MFVQSDACSVGDTGGTHVSPRRSPGSGLAASASRATVRDVAQAAGVSLGTVSNFLNAVKPIAPETRARIESAIDQLDFVPNRALRTMHGGHSGAIGYVVPDSPDPFFVELARGVESVARENGLVLVSCNTEGTRELEQQYLTALAEMRVAGAIVVPSFRQVDLPFRSLRASGTALVVLGEWDDDTCSIEFDNIEWGRLAAAHLLELGHRSIAFVGGPGGERQVEERLLGMEAAIRDSGITGVRLRRIDAVDSSVTERAELASRLLALDTEPTAVFCANDTLALAIMNSLLRRGLSVPGDMSIVGFNDIAAARLAVVPLTTVTVPQFDIGTQAAELLLRELEADHVHQHITMGPHFAARESSGPVAPPRGL